MRVDAKIHAREWILSAIQNHPRVPDKNTEREIRKFVGRLQRDIRAITRSRELYIALNAEKAEERKAAIKRLGELPTVQIKGRKRKTREREREIRRLIKQQRDDKQDRKIRFEHAISK